MTPLEELIPDPWFPFEGDITIKALLPPVVPEPKRSGESADDCSTCHKPDDSFVWTDDTWLLQAYRQAPFPGVVLLQPRGHYDSYTDLPDHLLTALGPMTARVERAVQSIGNVARVHVVRWGDGSGHFHLWFMPRPLGALQMRGSSLVMWMDILPDLPDADIDVALATIAAAMRAGD